MVTASRIIRQPGRVSETRIESIEGPARRIEYVLEPGINLRDALVGPLKRAGIEGATVRIEGLDVRSLHFVRPAAAKDDQHVAFYSDPHAIGHHVHIDLACATIGCKDGSPFVHCHALWKAADGSDRGGHLYTDQVVVASPARVRAWGLANATMQADFDEETNFTLFHPVEVASGDELGRGDGKRTAIARIRPNVDLLTGIEAVCARHGFARAVVRGSVGSTVGVLFDDGRVVEDIATEILVLEGSVDNTPAGPRASLDIALIDPRGNVHKGRFARGDNPVLICFELVLEEAA